MNKSTNDSSLMVCNVSVLFVILHKNQTEKNSFEIQRNQRKARQRKLG